MLVIPREAKRPVQMADVLSSEREKTHAEQLMKQLNKENESHSAHLNSCATEMCCHLRCRNLQNGIKSGRHCN